MPTNNRFLFLIAVFTIFAPAICSAAQKITFQLDWLPGGDKAPIYVGLQRGFFAAEGLDVHVVSGRGSTDAITKIATGSADIGLCDLTALLTAKASNKVPVTAIYSVLNRAPYAFYTIKNSGIQHVRDVKGKTIATSPFTSANLFLPLLLRENQLPEESVKLLKTDPGALAPMLIMGRTEVIISWLTDEVKIKQQATQIGREITVLPWHDAGLDFYATSVIANDKFLQRRPEVAKKFLRAFNKAVVYTWANPLASAKSVNIRVPEVDTNVAAETILSMKDLVINEVSAAQGLGVFDPQRLLTTWQWTAKAQSIPVKKYNPEDAVNRKFLGGQQP